MSSLSKYLVLIYLSFLFNNFVYAGSLDCQGPNYIPKKEDIQLVEKWCHDENMIKYIWNQYKLGKGDWSKSGYNSLCDARYALPRVMSAGYRIFQLSKNNKQFNQGLRLKFDNADAIYDWTTWAIMKNAQGYTPYCTDDANLAARNDSTLVPIKLTQVLTNTYTTDFIAATMLHELVHNTVIHAPYWTCKSEQSCDYTFGKYNANTLEIYHLMDMVNAHQHNAAGEYMLTLTNTQTSPIKKYGYKFVGLNSDREKVIDAALIDGEIRGSFESTSIGSIDGMKYYNYFVEPVVKLFQNSYEQKFCAYNDYNFSLTTRAQIGSSDYYSTKTSFGKESCNEAYNSENTKVNIENKTKCLNLINEIDNIVASRSDISMSKLVSLIDSKPTSKSCKPALADGYKKYCDSIITTSNNEILNIDKFGLYTDRSSLHWNSVAQDAISCCQNIKNTLGVDSFKFKFLDCDSMAFDVCSQGSASLEYQNACAACTFSDEEPLKCYYEHGKQIPFGCTSYDDCMDLVNDEEYCRDVKNNCM